MIQKKMKDIFWLNTTYSPKYFCFLGIFCVILSCVMVNCGGRVKPQTTTKRFLPKYMRSIYINHFVNKTSEMTLDIEVREILLDHYSKLNFKRRKVPFVVEKHHTSARLILMMYLNKAIRLEKRNLFVVDFDVSLKVNQKDQYLLKRENFIVVLPLQQRNVAKVAAKEIIRILDHFVETGVFVGKKYY